MVCRVSESKITELTVEHILFWMIIPFKIAVPTYAPSNNTWEFSFPTFLTSSLIIKLYRFFFFNHLVFISLLGLSLELHKIYILILEEQKSIEYWIFPSKIIVFSLHLFRFPFVFFSNSPLAPTTTTVLVSFLYAYKILGYFFLFYFCCC